MLFMSPLAYLNHSKSVIDLFELGTNLAWLAYCRNNHTHVFGGRTEIFFCLLDTISTVRQSKIYPTDEGEL
jgi:hypothetical protein